MLLSQINIANKLPLYLLPLILTACVSTELDSNLDTQVVAQNNQIKFSWDKKHPFAKEYAQGTMSLIAEYQEVTLNGKTKPVRQIIARSYQRRQSIENPRIFTLPNKLSSMSNSENICLYLSINRRPIPIRASSASDTARFSYPQWQQLVVTNTKNQIINSELSTATNNLRYAEQQLETKQRQFQHHINDFNQQLQQENLVQNVNIQNSSQCASLRIAGSNLVKPHDVVEQENITTTANKVCTHRAKVGMEKGYANVISVLPYSFLKAAKQPVKTSDMTPIRKKQYQAFRSTFIKYYDTIGKNSSYQPELGKKSDSISISSYSKDLQMKAYKYLTGDKRLNDKENEIITKIVSVELEAFGTCVVEGEKQLTTKLLAWQNKVKSTPSRDTAKESFLRKKCQALFKENEVVLNQLSQEKQKATSDLERTKKLIAQGNSTMQLPPQDTVLNQNSCSLY